jgi:hypothetical protein
LLEFLGQLVNNGPAHLSGHILDGRMFGFLDVGRLFTTIFLFSLDFFRYRLFFFAAKLFS